MARTAVRKSKSRNLSKKLDAPDNVRDAIVIADFIKYNIYLLSKSIVFNSLLTRSELKVEDAIEITDKILKRFTEQDNPSKDKQ